MLDYTITPARYTRTGAMVIHCPSPEGYLTRAGKLAQTFGRWVHRQGGYVVTANGAKRFEKLYNEGWNASVVVSGAKARFLPEARP